MIHSSSPFSARISDRESVERFRAISPVSLRAAFTAGVPVWGSCWGLQLAAVALGGSVRRNPRGRELPIARAITMTEVGRADPLLASRPAVFDALCSHLDEIETSPPNSRILAGNEVSAIQGCIGRSKFRPRGGGKTGHRGGHWRRMSATKILYITII